MDKLTVAEALKRILPPINPKMAKDQKTAPRKLSVSEALRRILGPAR